MLTQFRLSPFNKLLSTHLPLSLVRVLPPLLPGKTERVVAGDVKPAKKTRTRTATVDTDIDVEPVAALLCFNHLWTLKHD